MTLTRHIVAFVPHHVVSEKSRSRVSGCDRTIQLDKYSFQKIVQIISFIWDCGCIVSTPPTSLHSFPLSSLHKKLICDNYFCTNLNIVTTKTVLLFYFFYMMSMNK